MKKIEIVFQGPQAPKDFGGFISDQEWQAAIAYIQKPYEPLLKKVWFEMEKGNKNWYQTSVYTFGNAVMSALRRAGYDWGRDSLAKNWVPLLEDAAYLLFSTSTDTRVI